MGDNLQQDHRIMFNYRNKKKFGTVVGLLTKDLYIVQLDKRIKEYKYDCLGVYAHNIIAMEDEVVNAEDYTGTGGCCS